MEYDDRASIPQRTKIDLTKIVLNNLIVEAIIVSLVSSIFVVLKITDKLFRSKTKYVFMETIHIISQDQLSSVRETQIKFLFRRVYALGYTCKARWRLLLDVDPMHHWGNRCQDKRRKKVYGKDH